MNSAPDIIHYIQNEYDISPEYLWKSYPDYAAFRHKTNRKWFALYAPVPGNKVGLDTEEVVDIIDVKGDPDLIAFLCTQPGYAPAYHMNKQHWISVILDGTLSDDQVYDMIDRSYEMTR